MMAAVPEESLTTDVVDFVHELRPSALSENAVRAATSLVMDAIACAIAAVDQPGMAELKDVAFGQSGVDEVSIIGEQRRVSRPAGALINGSLIHALDFDDKNYEAGMHVCAAVLPVALAEAQLRQASGSDLLAALVAGVEVTTRLGEAAVAAKMANGFLPSSLIAGFGAAAAGGHLARLSPTSIRNALGLTLAQASGTRQALLDKSLAKRLQPGFAARNAAFAVQLAERGISGARRVFEGEAGLFPLYVGVEAPRWTALEHRTGTWAVERYWVKQFPSCGGAHRATLAAIRLARSEALVLDTIDRIDVHVPALATWHLADPYRPAETPQVAAQFSIRYGVAVGLLRQAAGIKEFTDESLLRSPDILALCERTQIHAIPGTDGNRSDEVPVTLQVAMGNRVLEETVVELPGQPTSPVDLDPAETKLRESLAYVGAHDGDRLVSMLHDLTGVDVGELMSALAQVGHLRAMLRNSPT